MVVDISTDESILGMGTPFPMGFCHVHVINPCCLSPRFYCSEETDKADK